MRKTTICSLWLLAILLLANESQAQESGWARFSPPGGGFSILVPGNRRSSSVKSLRREDGHPENPTQHKFTFLSESVVCDVTWIDSSYEIDVQNTIASMRRTLLGALNARLLTEKEVAFNGHPGLEFTAQIPGWILTARIFVVGNRPYSLVVARPEKSDLADTTKFLSSFKLEFNK